MRTLSAVLCLSVASAKLSCKSLSPSVSDGWCDLNCNAAGVPNCPPSLCSCDGTPPAPAPTPGPSPPAPGPAPGPSPPAPGPGPAPASPCFNERRIAYFAAWAIYGRDFHPWQMDLGRLSHVNYAFMDLNEQCDVVSGDTYGDFEKKNPEVGQTWSGEGSELPGGSIGAFRIMRDGLSEVAKANGHYHPHIKIMLSLGGWTWSKHFSTCAVDDTKRARFVKSAVDMLVETDSDGLDFDWEYPTGCVYSDANNTAADAEDVKCGLEGNSHNPIDWEVYIKLLKEVKAEYNARNLQDKLITTAAGMSPKLNNDAPLKEWVDAQDFVNFMTYDYNGAWDLNGTAHQAPLNQISGLPPESPQDFNIADTVDVFLKKGIEPSKITLGLASYARCWTGTEGYLKPATGPCVGPIEDGVLSWHDIRDNYIGKGDWQRKWDPEAMAPYLYSASKKDLIVYDDEESIQAKVQYAIDKGFGGFMWWEASDDKGDDLHSAAVVAWGGDCKKKTKQHLRGN